MNYLLIITAFLIPTALCQRTFNNPIFEGDSPDPAVLRLGSSYYLTLSTNDKRAIAIYKSQTLTNFRNATQKIIFQAPEGYINVWASELHQIDGQIYLYFTMQGTKSGDLHHMYVSKAQNPNDLLGNWDPEIRLMPDDESRAIDGTVLQHGNGNLYFMWSLGSIRPGALVIAQMPSPISVNASSKIILREPKSEWECHTTCINEGPFFIYNKNVSYLVFSASAAFDPNYSLGVMSIPDNKDPLNVTNWWFGEDNPVFSRNDAENVFAPGHSTFTTSLDGSETWMIYHASPKEVVTDRVANAQKISWNQTTGMPIFPLAHGYSYFLDVPSGEN